MAASQSFFTRPWWVRSTWQSTAPNRPPCLRWLENFEYARSLSYCEKPSIKIWCGFGHKVGVSANPMLRWSRSDSSSLCRVPLEEGGHGQQKAKVKGAQIDNNWHEDFDILNPWKLIPSSLGLDQPQWTPKFVHEPPQSMWCRSPIYRC